MARHNLLLLPGDGIGPEVASELHKVLTCLTETGESGRSRPRQT